MDTQSKAVCFRQPNGHLENIRPATILQAMPIQMGRLERRRQYGLDLRPKFHFQFRELCLSQKFGDAFYIVEKASLIDQGGHLVPGGERPPPIMDQIADDGQVNTEGKIRMVREQMHGMQSPGARNNKRASSGYPNKRLVCLLCDWVILLVSLQERLRWGFPHRRGMKR